MQRCIEVFTLDWKSGMFFIRSKLEIGKFRWHCFHDDERWWLLTSIEEAARNELVGWNNTTTWRLEGKQHIAFAHHHLQDNDRPRLRWITLKALDYFEKYLQYTLVKHVNYPYRWSLIPIEEWSGNTRVAWYLSEGKLRKCSNWADKILLASYS